jgi:hypothetical protein
MLIEDMITNIFYVHCDRGQVDTDAVDLDMSRLMKELGSVFSAKEISSMMSEGLADENTDSSSDGDLGT